MKITVKTLQQKVFQVSSIVATHTGSYAQYPTVFFQVDVEGDDTIASLKAKIQDLQGHAIASQKIIYSGRVIPTP